MYSSQDSSHSFFQNSSGCTHLKIRHDVRTVFEVACRQQHLHSGSCQVLRGKISGVGFLWHVCEVALLLRDFLLHPEPLDSRMLQSSTTLARCDPNSSTRVRQDDCLHRHPNPSRMAWLCKLWAEPFVIALNSDSPVPLRDCVELRCSCAQCSQALRAGCILDRRSLRSTPQLQTRTSALSLWLQGPHPQTRRCSSVAVDTGTSTPTSDCSSGRDTA